MSRPNTKEGFIQAIYYKLGFPYQKMQLSPEQIDQVVWESLDFYTKNIYDGTQEKVLVLDTQENVMEYSFDQTGFPSNIWAVTDIVESYLYGSFFPMPYGPTQQDIEFLFSLGRLSNGTLVDASVAMQNLEAFKKMFIPKVSWNFNFNRYSITFNFNPRQRRYALICSALVSYDGSEGGTNQVWGNAWLLKHASAIAKQYWAMSLGRQFEGLSLPGGGSIAHDKLYTEGKEEQKELEEFALENLSFSPGSMGIYLA